MNINTNDAGGLRESEAKRRAEEGGGARRGQDGGEHAVEERARGSMFRGQSPGGAHDAPARVDFEQPEEVQRHEGHQRGEQHEELRVAELHPPAGFVSGSLDANHQARQHEERHQHAERVDQAQFADLARLILGLPDKAEDLQGDDGQDAGHDVQNQPAQESVEQHLPKRRSGEPGCRAWAELAWLQQPLKDRLAD